jgi:DnaK suppressor protein
MARKDAILRLHKHLLARRESLCKALKLEIEDLSDMPDLATGDSADAASDAAHHAVSSQIAELESRELAKIERALQQIRRGKYGVCEGCSKKIPLARLNALPYTTLCVMCQRDEEQSGGRGDDFESGGWDKVYEIERSQRDEQIRLSDIELDLSGSGR